jgi:hypothetical protein
LLLCSTFPDPSQRGVVIRLERRCHKALIALAGVGWPIGTARAAMLTLSCELLSSGTNPSCPATAPMYAVPDQYNYQDSFTAPTGSTAIAGSNIYGGPANGFLGPAGFIDDYFFQIALAQADMVSTTIDLGGVFSIGNLFERIYSLSANPSGLVLTTPGRRSGLRNRDAERSGHAGADQSAHADLRLVRARDFGHDHRHQWWPLHGHPQSEYGSAPRRAAPASVRAWWPLRPFGPSITALVSEISAIRPFQAKCGPSLPAPPKVGPVKSRHPCAESLERSPNAMSSPS